MIEKREKMETRMGWRLVRLLLFLATSAAIVGVLGAGKGGAGEAAHAAPLATSGFGLRSGLPDSLVVVLFGPLGSASSDVSQNVQITDLSDQVYVVDLPSMGVHAMTSPPPESAIPDGGAVGLGGAFMNVSPEVISQSVPSAVAVLSANWTPSETVALSVNGGAPTNLTASSTGRIGMYLNVGAGEGWITLEQRGLTSGRQTGGVVEVRDSGAPLPGLAIGPHSINPNGSSTINVLGTRWKPGNVTFARNSTAINTLTAGATGTFYYAINVAAGADTSAIYSAYTTTVGSRVGQSIEERADAGVPPYGDQNITRAFVDRPVVASTGGTVAIVGEGFQSGETVNVTTCGTLSGTADSNGVYRLFAGLSGSGVGQCVLTGAVSGRVARASTLVSNDAINAPGVIVAPAAVGGTGNVTLIIDRLLPNQSGTVYRDGVSLGSFSTDSSGKAAAFVGKPTSGFVHDYRWVGATGQSVSAPLLYLPAGGTPTPTRTPTRTPTSTYTPTRTPTFTPVPTNTPIPPSSTPLPTNTQIPTNTPIPSSTPIPPTSTPLPSSTGIPTNTPIPTHTPIPTNTYTPTPTPTRTITPRPTQTAGGATATPEPPTPTTQPTATVGEPTPCAITFTDVPADHAFYSYIRCLACRGIISGYADGTFRPGNDVTRGQIAKIVSNAAGFEDDPGPQIYEDVKSSNTFYTWINRLSGRGFMSGYDCGTVPEEPCVPPDNRPYFRPVNNTTRGQLAKIVSNAAGIGGPQLGQFYTDVPQTHPFYIWIMRLTTLGVMSGYSCGGAGEPCDSQNRPYFRPFNNVTRGQASKIVANTFYPDCQTPAR